MKKYVSTEKGYRYITPNKLYEVVSGGCAAFIIQRDDGELSHYSKKKLGNPVSDWTTHNIGTIAEIGASVGDLVASIYWNSKLMPPCKVCENDLLNPSPEFYIVSRAPVVGKFEDMDAETATACLDALEQQPKTLGEMTNVDYRKKTAEPVRETVTLYGAHLFWRDAQRNNDSYRITFDTLDGEVDYSSIEVKKTL